MLRDLMQQVIYPLFIDIRLKTEAIRVGWKPSSCNLSQTCLEARCSCDWLSAAVTMTRDNQGSTLGQAFSNRDRPNRLTSRTRNKSSGVLYWIMPRYVSKKYLISRSPASVSIPLTPACLFAAEYSPSSNCLFIEMVVRRSSQFEDYSFR